MGKTLRRLSTVLVILSFVLPVSGIEPAKEFITATIKIGSTTATVDGRTVRLRSTIDIKDRKTFIYSADLGNIMSIRFPWSPGNKMSTGYDPLTETTLIYYADSNKAGIDGDEFVSSAKPYIKKTKKDNFFMVPLRYTCDVFGWSISTDSNKNIIIKKPLVLRKGSWIIPGGDQSRTFCTSNGQAPKGQKLVEDWGFKKGEEETSNLYFDGKVLSNDITGWTCFDATTKKQLWKKDCDENDRKNCQINPFAQLVFCDGKVIYNVGLTAFDATTGDVAWQLDETSGSSCAAFDGMVLAGKYTIHDNNSYPQIGNADICCYQVSDGRKLWQKNVYKNSDLYSFNFNKLIAGKDVFLLDWKVYETKTGNYLCDIPQEKDYTPFESGLIYTAYIKSSDSFAVYNREFIKLYDAKSGKLKNERKFGIFENFAVKNDRIYCYNMNNGKLTCLNTNNLETVWANEVDNYTIGKFAISGFQLISANPWFISGYGLETGKLLWKQDISKIITGYKGFDLAIVDRFIYITTWIPFQKFTYRFAIAP